MRTTVWKDISPTWGEGLSFEVQRGCSDVMSFMATQALWSVWIVDPICDAAFEPCQWSALQIISGKTRGVVWVLATTDSDQTAQLLRLLVTSYYAFV